MLYDTKWDATTAPDPYLPAAALGLRPRERAALIRVLALLETQAKTVTFNMGAYYHDIGPLCGTPACMAGWADHLGQLDWFSHKRQGGHTTARFSLVTQSEQNYRLFHPPIDMGSWRTIPPATAARALRAYLTRGAPDWSPAPAP